MIRIALWAVSTCIMVLCTSVVSGQEYPSKHIRIVTGAVGNGSDITARLIGQGISVSLGQRVVVENRTGEIIGREIVSGTPSDGYAVLTYS